MCDKRFWPRESVKTEKNEKTKFDYLYRRPGGTRHPVRVINNTRAWCIRENSHEARGKSRLRGTFCGKIVIALQCNICMYAHTCVIVAICESQIIGFGRKPGDGGGKTKTVFVNRLPRVSVCDNRVKICERVRNVADKNKKTTSNRRLRRKIRAGKNSVNSNFNCAV